MVEMKCQGFANGCLCEKCEAQIRKCARAGCTNHRIDGSLFCLSCVVTGRALPRTHSACDNLPSIPEDDGLVIEIFDQLSRHAD